MKRSASAAVAALLVLLAGWIMQDKCTTDLLACNMSYLLATFSALSDVLATIPPPP